MNKAFQMMLAAVAACAVAHGQDDVITEDGVFFNDTGMDPLFSTPSTIPMEPETDGSRPTLIPNDYYFEYLGPMHVHGQSAHVRMMNVFATLPLLNPRKHAWHGWHLDAKVSGRLTWAHNSGNRVLDEPRLYTVGASATLIRQVGSKSQFHLGFTPQVSSDFDTFSHEIFYWGGNVGFSSAAGEKFKYTLGVSVMPDFNDMWVYPLVNFQWRLRPNWELQLQAERLSYQFVSSSGSFRVGPFIQHNRSVWTVKRQRATRMLRMNNWIAGLSASYRKSLSTCKVSVLGDLGFTFYNNFRVRTKDGEHTLERYRADGGLYARVGVGVEF